MYQIIITPSAKRSLKKLPINTRKTLIEATSVLVANPYAGNKLSNPLQFLYSLHFKTKNVQYRVAYTIDKKNNLIVIHFAHTRENFYDKLRKLFH